MDDYVYITEQEQTEAYKAEVRKLKDRWGWQLVFDTYDEAWRHQQRAWVNSGQKGYDAKVMAIEGTLQGHFGMRLHEQLSSGKSAEEIITANSYTGFIEASIPLLKELFGRDAERILREQFWFLPNKGGRNGG
jgi:hypothetical protein